MSPPLIVIGASAGGTEALMRLVAALPAGLPAAVLIVMHVPPHGVSQLPQILSRSGPLPASHARDGEALRAGHIYVAPPDHHLLVEAEQASVGRGPRENRFRPSIDALFRSAAYTHGARVVGVVLSGLMDDGTSGLWTIKRLGGAAIVQDPQEALFDSMPLSALQHVEVDATLPVTEIAARLVAFAASLAGPPEDAAAQPEPDEATWARLRLEVEIAARGHAFERRMLNYGAPSVFACPECHGVLLEIGEGSLTRYRCHTGHAYTASALLAEITEQAEKVLWEGKRALEEATLLLDELGQRFERQGEGAAAGRFYQQARATEARGLLLLRVLGGHDILSGAGGVVPPPALPTDD